MKRRLAKIKAYLLRLDPRRRVYFEEDIADVATTATHWRYDRDLIEAEIWRLEKLTEPAATTAVFKAIKRIRAEQVKRDELLLATIRKQFIEKD